MILGRPKKEIKYEYDKNGVDSAISRVGFTWLHYI